VFLIKSLSGLKIVNLHIVAKKGSAATDSAARLCRWQCATSIKSKKSALIATPSYLITVYLL
jgi:hypothetical protein